MNRKHPRLPGYDYSQNGTYFLTLCTKHKAHLFGYIVGRDDPGAPMKLTAAGESVKTYINSISEAYPFASVDKYVIMPNHVHMLLTINAEHSAPRSSRPTELIPRIVAALKRFSNRDAGEKLWQDGYYDHIIRDRQDYLIRWQYIDNNPIKWVGDEYYTT